MPNFESKLYAVFVCLGLAFSCFIFYERDKDMDIKIDRMKQELEYERQESIENAAWSKWYLKHIACDGTGYIDDNTYSSDSPSKNLLEHANKL